VDAEEQLEDMFSGESDSEYASELSEILEVLRKDPVPVNTADKEELSNLIWLSAADIRALIRYRSDTKIRSSEDLQKAGLDVYKVEAILPFITFKSKIRPGLLQQTRAEYKESKKAFPSTLKYYNKTILKLDRIETGFISQKDEGERDPLDFYSAYIAYRGYDHLRYAVLGHYRLGFGQGVLFAPKLGNSKSSAAIITPRKKMTSLRPYTSSYEIWDLRGVAAEVVWKKFKLLPFYSDNEIGVNLVGDRISSFDNSGIHLDEVETVDEKVMGLNLEYNDYPMNLGFTAYSQQFGKPFLDEKKEQEYGAFSFYGRLDRFGIPVFWEAASAAGKLAVVGGMEWGEERIRFLALIRSYEKRFPTWHGKAFSAQSSFDNEKGVYLGVRFIPVGKIRLNFYFDVWQFPHSRFHEKLPTWGNEKFLQADLKTGDHRIRFQAKQKTALKYSSVDGVGKIRELTRELLRGDWSQQVGKFRFKTRLEFSRVRNPEQIKGGWLCYQELRFGTGRVTLVGNYAVFNSGVYHYMYENSVSGVMQNRMLKGDGNSFYLLAKIKLNSEFTLQAKYAAKPDDSQSRAAWLQIILTL
jgi:hypothetical protein